jgi:hypothetical protein
VKKDVCERGCVCVCVCERERERGSCKNACVKQTPPHPHTHTPNTHTHTFGAATSTSCLHFGDMRFLPSTRFLERHRPTTPIVNTAPEREREDCMREIGFRAGRGKGGSRFKTAEIGGKVGSSLAHSPTSHTHTHMLTHTHTHADTHAHAHIHTCTHLGALGLDIRVTGLSERRSGLEVPQSDAYCAAHLDVTLGGCLEGREGGRGRGRNWRGEGWVIPG